MAKIPLPHQLEGAEFLASRKRGALWFLPRVGKTLTTILALEKIEAKSILVICPSTVQRVWLDELAERGIKAKICKGDPVKKRKIMHKEAVVICTYESSWRLNANGRKWDAIVFDESIKLANWQTKQTSHWFAIEPDTAVFLLSGAPCPEGYLQIASQMIICRGIWFGHVDIYGYLQEYWHYDKDRYTWICDFPGHLTEVARRVKIIGMAKSREDLGMADRKFYSYLPVEADDAQIKALAHVEASDREPVHKAMYAQRIGSGWDENGELISMNKIQAIAAWIKERTEVEPDFRAVVMCRYKDEIPLIAKSIGGSYINGDVIGAERDRRIQGFQSGKHKHLVCQVVVAKMGIDLSKARTIIYASNSWSGDDRIQSQERCTNLNLQDPVQIIDVIVEGPGFGIDYAIAQAIRDKKDFNANLLRN